MDGSPAEQVFNRIERGLDLNNPPGGKPPVRRSGGWDNDCEGGKSGNRILEGELVKAVFLVFLFVVSAALAFADRFNTTEHMQLTTGSVGGAVGLLIGYGVGRLRP